LGPDYSEFLIEELLPFVESETGLQLTDDPERRICCGTSSGGLPHSNALDWAGYDYRFEFGTGGHSIAHGGTLFADSIRWLLR